VFLAFLVEAGAGCFEGEEEVVGWSAFVGFEEVLALTEIPQVCLSIFLICEVG
jgi:hypothetical protein